MVLSSADPLLSAHLSDRIRIGEGLAVRAVESKSSAETAGFQVHDVILRLNSTSISTLDELVKLAASVALEDQIEFEILRAGGIIKLKIAAKTIPPLEANDNQNTSPRAIAQSFSNEVATVGITSNDGQHFRVEVSYMTAAGAKQIHEFFGTLDGIHGHVADLPKAVADLVVNQLERVFTKTVTNHETGSEPLRGPVSFSYANNRVQLTINSDDGVQFDVNLGYRDAHGVMRKFRFNEQTNKLSERLRSTLPNDISAIVVEQLDHAGILVP